jgi:hypothetical protein
MKKAPFFDASEIPISTDNDMISNGITSGAGSLQVVEEVL